MPMCMRGRSDPGADRAGVRAIRPSLAYYGDTQGRVEAVSTVGSGSVFSVYLPLLHQG